MTFYGNDVSIDNFRSETVFEGSTQLQNPDEAYARIHYDDTSKLVYDGQDTYTFDDLTFEITQRDAQYMFSGTYCGQYRHAKQPIYNIIWDVGVEVPKDRITVDVGEIVIADTTPGEKSLTANVTITDHTTERTDGGIPAAVMPITVKEMAHRAQKKGLAGETDMQDP